MIDINKKYRTRSGYQWEKLKQNLIADLLRQAEFPSGLGQELAAVGLIMPVEDMDTNWKTKITDRINQWDIRMAKSLIDIFPDRFPKSLRNRTSLEAFIDDKKGWVIR